MKAEVLKCDRNPHLVGLVGEITREREIEDITHYHISFAEHPGMHYHFMEGSVSLIEESNAEVDASSEDA